MSQWYYADNANSRQGPVDDDALTRLQREGHVRWDTLVWREGMAEWRPLAEFAEQFQATGDSAGASLDLRSGSVVADDTPESPYAPPKAPLMGTPQVHLGGEIVYAGFWKRVAAYLIDSMIVGMIGGLIGGMVGGILGAAMFRSEAPAGLLAIQAVAQLLSLAAGATYFGWFHASSHQATPGKMAIGIKVTRGDGQRIGFWRGFGRYFALIVSSLTLCIGFMMAGFTERKRALHDMMCDTLVVDKWAYTDRPDLQRHELGTVATVVLVIGGLLMLAVVAAIVFAIGLAATVGH